MKGYLDQSAKRRDWYYLELDGELHFLTINRYQQPPLQGRIFIIYHWEAQKSWGWLNPHEWWGSWYSMQGAIGSLRRRVFDTFHDRLQWRACGGGSLPAAWHVGHGEVAFSGSAVPQTSPKDTKYPPVNPTWQWKITHLVISHESFGLVRVWLYTEGYSNSFSGPAKPRLAARSDPQKCSVWGFTALHIAVEERGTQIKSNLKLEGCNVFEPKYSNPNKMDTQ